MSASYKIILNFKPVPLRITFELQSLMADGRYTLSHSKEVMVTFMSPIIVSLIHNVLYSVTQSLSLQQVQNMDSDFWCLKGRGQVGFRFTSLWKICNVQDTLKEIFKPSSCSEAL